MSLRIHCIKSNMSGTEQNHEFLVKPFQKQKSFPMCACVCQHMLFMCSQACGGQRPILGSSSISCDTVFESEPSLHQFSRTSCPSSAGTSCLPLQLCGDRCVTMPLLCYYEVTRDSRTQVCKLAKPALSQLSSLPAKTRSISFYQCNGNSEIQIPLTECYVCKRFTTISYVLPVKH